MRASFIFFSGKKKLNSGSGTRTRASTQDSSKQLTAKTGTAVFLPTDTSAARQAPARKLPKINQQPSAVHKRKRRRAF
jgi:hypothetical protein